MNIIISFAGLENRQSQAPYALRRLAGSTILGHILARLLDLSIKRLVLVVDSDMEKVERWVRTHAPTLPLQMILAEDAKDPVTGLNKCRAVLDANQLLFISGSCVTGTTYQDLVSLEDGASCLIQAEQDEAPAEILPVDEAGFLTLEESARRVRWAGSCWFRHGTDLVEALDSLRGQKGYGMESLLIQLSQQGLRISTWQTRYCLDTHTVENMLLANARLLHLDYGTQDAIERSYAEDFTVLPPVFLHETAVIENSVIGPFVNLEAHAKVRNSIVRNSLIGTGSEIIDAILENSLIGDDARIIGRKSTVIAADGEDVMLFNESDKTAVNK